MGSDMAGVPNAASTVQEFRAARQKIAKTYAAEKALDAQGNINPQVYAKELKKGRPLTGGAKEVAEFARDFPRSSQKPGNMGSIYGPTWADAILGGMGGIGGAAAHGIGAGIGIPAGAALLARPGARAAIASDPYQAAFIRRNPSAGKGLAASQVADEQEKRP